MSKSNKKNLIIGGLLAIVLIMAVGYAAFATNLNINGSSAITSNWDVHIKDNGVNAKNPTQGAASTKARKVDALTGEFACTLQIPGTSSIEYDIEVENLGSFDATLDTVTISGTTEAVSAVVTESSSLKQGDTITKNGGTDTLTIKVSLNDISQLPDVTTINITVTLDFSQATGGSGGGGSNPTVINENNSDLTVVYSFPVNHGVLVGETVINSSEVETDYRNLNKIVFLKYELDEENIIQNAYACLIYDNTKEPICLQGAGYNEQTGTSPYYQNNIAKIQTIENYFGENACSYNTSESAYICESSSKVIIANPNGIVGTVNLDGGFMGCYVGQPTGSNEIVGNSAHC